ncbi:hypothetical protein RQP46_004047 [Phenoliferia psychrophenolica]
MTSTATALAENVQSSGSVAYTLPRDSVETRRLDEQHFLLKACFSNSNLHPTVRKALPAGADVLESATGTTIWLRDLANTEGIKLGSVTAFDLSSLQFPPATDRKLPHGGGSLPLKLFEHNVTHPLPTEFDSKFDLVNQRLLVLGLRTEEWPGAVANLAATLKPGGWLQLSEVYPVMRDFGESSAIDSFNVIMKLACTVGGKDMLCLEHLEGHMLSAGLKSTEKWDGHLRFGAHNADRTLGEALSQWIGATLLGTWRAVHSAAPSLLPPGLQTSEESQVLYKSVIDHLNLVGGIATFGMVIGQKA